MLPGFRFLFTAIVLSMSVLTFGLGAAALLRAAHEEFANLPARRTAPAPMFARPTDETPPTLALLRIDTSVEEKPVKDVAAAPIPEAAADTPAQAAPAADTGAMEPEKLAAMKPAEPMQAEAAKPETPAKEATAETPAPPPAAAVAETPAPPKAQAAAAEVKLAAVAETPQPVAAPTALTALDIYSESNSAATRIATLGGPAVIVDEQTSAKTTDAKPDQSTVKKRAAERARERRRIIAARRARIAREATLTLQQQQPNPFIQTPFAQDPIARTR